MTLSDDAVASGITTAALPGSRPSMQKKGFASRGRRYSTRPVVMANCRHWERRHPTMGPMTPHDTRSNGTTPHYCLECARLGNLEHHRRTNGETQKKLADPTHQYYATSRENSWRHQGILCVTGCAENQGFFCYPHYQQLMSLQNGRCAVCDRIFFLGLKPHAAADHEHRNPDGSGPIRGLLCGGKTGCNLHIIARYENGHRDNLTEEAQAKARQYLNHPPAEKLQV